MPSRTLLQSIGCSLVALLLTACALDPIQPGMTREAVLATLSMLAGSAADLDASDHVAQVRQVLVQQEFARITPGTWTRADVEREFGRPASVDRVANWPSDILTYRWYEVQDMFYWVYLDAANVVRRTEQGIEYHHDDMN